MWQAVSPLNVAMMSPPSWRFTSFMDVCTCAVMTTSEPAHARRCGSAKPITYRSCSCRLSIDTILSETRRIGREILGIQLTFRTVVMTRVLSGWFVLLIAIGPVRAEDRTGEQIYRQTC